MIHLDLSSFMKRTNQFMIFNLSLCAVIAITFYIIGLNIHDYSDYPNAKLNGNVDNRFSGLIEIFVNNAFIVPLVSLIIAIIPIPYLYLIPTISTLFSLSMSIGIQFAYKTNEGIALLIGILPHSLLEIYIISLELSIIFIVNKYFRKVLINLFKKKKEHLPHFLCIIKFIVKYYLMFMVPLAFICAFIEVFITPNWYSFLKKILVAQSIYF